MRVVIDCNVLIAAGLKDGLCRAVLKYVIAHSDVYLSEQILLEYLLIIRRSKFKDYRDILEKFVILLTDVAHIIEEKEINYTLPDPEDLKYLKVAFSSSADIIITGNIKDFPERKYQNIQVLMPREFYDVYIESIP